LSLGILKVVYYSFGLDRKGNLACLLMLITKFS